MSASESDTESVPTEEQLEFAQKMRDASEEAIDDWIEDEGEHVREVEGQVIIEKEDLAQKITVMACIATRQM